jgi:hypothetical protein
MSVAAAGPQVAGALPADVDDTLAGGGARTHIHLVASQSGTGRTTLGLSLPGKERGSCITLFVINNEVVTTAGGQLPSNRTDAKR